MTSWKSPPGKAGGRGIRVLGCRRPVLSYVSFLLLASGKKEWSLHSLPPGAAGQAMAPEIGRGLSLWKSRINQSVDRTSG